MAHIENVESGRAWDWSIAICLDVWGPGWEGVGYPAGRAPKGQSFPPSDHSLIIYLPPLHIKKFVDSR